MFIVSSHISATYTVDSNTDRVRYQFHNQLCSGWFRARGEIMMKAGIHPDYKEATVTCSCGNSFTTGSVKSDIKVEFCNECHPFYTGRQKFAAADGRVDRFNKKYGIKE